MSPLLQKMRLQARLYGMLKVAQGEKVREVLSNAITTIDAEIDEMIRKQNAMRGPSTNTYSDATVEFEDRMGYKYN